MAWEDEIEAMSESLRNHPGEWTMDCLEPAEFHGLIEGTIPQEETLNLRSHIDGCEWCQTEYTIQEATLQEARQLREMQEKLELHKKRPN